MLVVSRGLDRVAEDGSLGPYADLMSGEESRAGTVAVVTPGGRVRQVADDVWFPNGTVVTADGTTLVLAELYRSRLTAYHTAAAGELTGRRTWADLGAGVPDGICVDVEGGCFSCALGGPGGRTLFIVAATWLGPERMFVGERTGLVLTFEVPVPGPSRP